MKSNSNFLPFHYRTDIWNTQKTLCYIRVRRPHAIARKRERSSEPSEGREFLDVGASEGGVRMLPSSTRVALLARGIYLAKRRRPFCSTVQFRTKTISLARSKNSGFQPRKGGEKKIKMEVVLLFDERGLRTRKHC